MSVRRGRLQQADARRHHRRRAEHRKQALLNRLQGRQRARRRAHRGIGRPRIPGDQRRPEHDVGDPVVGDVRPEIRAALVEEGEPLMAPEEPGPQVGGQHPPRRLFYPVSLPLRRLPGSVGVRLVHPDRLGAIPVQRVLVADGACVAVTRGEGIERRLGSHRVAIQDVAAEHAGLHLADHVRRVAFLHRAGQRLAHVLRPLQAELGVLVEGRRKARGPIAFRRPGQRNPVERFVGGAERLVELVDVTERLLEVLAVVGEGRIPEEPLFGDVRDRSLRVEHVPEDQRVVAIVLAHGAMEIERVAQERP